MDSGAFVSQLAEFGAPTRVLAAVSGGSDSMALLHLAAAARDMGGPDVVAACVDHGLRDGSAREAEQVASWCASLGIGCKTLLWTGDKPTTGVQAAARAARYRLLCEAAHRAGAAAILTAHTRDDQAETVFMRLARGAGPRGLAGMTPRSMIAAGAGPAIALWRPLLSERRADLRDYLKARGQAYLDDPSNDDPKFERVRVRALLPALSEQDLLSEDALIASGSAARGACHALDEREAALFAASGGVILRDGRIEFFSAFLGEAQAPVLLRQAIYAVSGAEHPPTEAAAARAVDELAASGATALNGALVRLNADKVMIMREPAALLGRAGVAPMSPIVAPAGGKILWDRRFIITNSGALDIEVYPAAALAPRAPAPAAAALPAARAENGDIIDIVTEAGRLPAHAVALTKERFFRRVNRF